ncbi:MAG TPA: COX aromatic rich motif-containing protein, partial [Rhodanobacter sp.]|nr:COX aromatic rich motif-containing protein [Rhodanobacter sp.]
GWGIPCVIVACLAVLIWDSTHKLDPYRPLQSEVKPLQVDVIALNWKWLFIYPEYGVASVNQLAIPVGTPVNFRLTAESMMNAFFIPQLGSQIYAMAGMQTRLHLIARETGSYDGLSSNYSGAGFSDMRFKAIATTSQGFQDWLAKAKASSATLDLPTYKTLEQPSEKVPVSYYATVTPGLFEDILHKDMGGKPASGQPMKGMPMEGMPAHDGVAVAASHNDHAKAAE